jgi:hypothetical protein
MAMRVEGETREWESRAGDGDEGVDMEVDVPRDYAADEETVSRLLHDLEQASVGGDHHAAKSLIGTLEVALTHLDTCRLEQYVRSLARTPLPH